MAEDVSSAQGVFASVTSTCFVLFVIHPDRSSHLLHAFQWERVFKMDRKGLREGGAGVAGAFGKARWQACKDGEDRSGPADLGAKSLEWRDGSLASGDIERKERRGGGNGEAAGARNAPSIPRCIFM